MSLPMYTTTVLVERDESSEERWSERTYVEVADGWPAVVGSPTARDVESSAASSQVVDAVLYLDGGRATQRLDRVTDRTTGQQYQVVAILERAALGLDHHRAALRTIGELG